MARLVFKGEPYSPSWLSKHILCSVPSYFLFLLLLMLPPIFKVTEMREARGIFHSKSAKTCCSFPCQNGGICVESCNDYSCDCSGTQHYGKNCQHEMSITKIVRVNHDLWHGLGGLIGLRKIVEYFDFLQSFFYGKMIKSIVKRVPEPKFSSNHGGISNHVFNSCSEALLLSPVPAHCPTPLGVTGFHILPPLESLCDLILKRCGHMQTSSSKVNLLFAAYGQFLAKQMSCANNVNWLGSSGMYGNFERIHSEGKVSKTKTRKAHEECCCQGECCHGKQIDIFHTSTMSDAFENIILREHNRICDILYNSHPGWSDQQLYETASQIVTGEIITITANEWLPFVKDYGIKMKFKSPYTSIISNKVPYEIVLAFFWPQMYPDTISIGGSNIDLGVLSSGGVESLPRGGTYHLMKTLAATCSGKMGPKNVPAALEEKTKKLILEGRRRNLQSFNNYRVSLGLARCKSFVELTGDTSEHLLLQKMYGDIDGLEFIPGLLLEAPKKGMVLGDTMNALLSDFILKAVVTHPLTTTPYLRKSTFGGSQGWEIVKTANIKNLICHSLNEDCSNDVLSFSTKTCREETSCGKGPKTANPVQISPPKKRCRFDQLFDPSAKEDESTTKPEQVVSEDPAPPEIFEKIDNAPPKLQKQHCAFQKPSRPFNKPKHKPAVHTPRESTTCPKSPPVEVKPPTAKRCCIRRPWLRSKKLN